MLPITNVDTGTVETGSQDVFTLYGIAVGKITELDNMVSDTVASPAFMGEAANATGNASTAYQEVSRKLHQILDDAGSALGTVGTNHIQTQHDEATPLNNYAAQMNI